MRRMHRSRRSCGGVVRSLAWILGGGGAGLASCTAPELAANNIAGRPDAGAIDLDTVAQGVLPVYPMTLDPGPVALPLDALRAAMAGLFPGEGAFPEGFVAQVRLPPADIAGKANCTQDDACLYELGMAFSDATFVAGLVGTDLPIDNLALAGLALPHDDLETVQALLPGAHVDVFFLDGPRVERRKAHDRLGLLSSSVGLWFDFELRPRTAEGEPYTVTAGCNCFGADTGPVAALCPALELGNTNVPFVFPPATASTIVPGLCTPLPVVALPGPGEAVQLAGFGIQARINRIPLSIGLIPVRSDASDRPQHDGSWLVSYPGGRDLRLEEMFALRVVVLTDPSTEAVGDDAAALVASTADLVVWSNVEVVSPLSALLCETIDCDALASDVIADSLVQQLHGGVNGPDATGQRAGLASAVAPLFAFDGPLEGFPCNATAAPGAPGACSAAQLDTLLRATFSYFAWTWFATPFVPEGSDHFYPMVRVRTSDLTQPETHVEREPGGGLPAALLHGESGDQVGLLFDFDEDPDGDGILSPFDQAWTCPASANDGDGDGLDDDCDPCPFDPENDADGDGLCAQGPGGALTDNCPYDFNPSQANCNLEAEKHLTPDQLWGDACDPVPCPSDLAEPTTTKTVQIAGGAMVCRQSDRAPLAGNDAERAHLDVMPLASHYHGEGDLFGPVSVNDVPTHAFFCQKSVTMGVTCEDDDDFRAAERARDARCAPGVAPPSPEACVDPETANVSIEGPATRFRRLTVDRWVSTGSGQKLETYGPHYEDVPVLDYGVSAPPAPTPSEAQRLRWRADTDRKRWEQLAQIEPTTAPNCEAGIPGARLRGSLLLYAETLVGSPQTTYETGVHGTEPDDLIPSHYELDYSPRRVSCHPGKMLADFDLGQYLIYRKIPTFDAGDPLLPLGSPARADLITVIDGHTVALRDDGAVAFVDDFMGPVLSARLGDPTTRWFSQVEVDPRQGGADPAFPVAVALELDGSDLVDAATRVGGKLLADSDRGHVRTDVVGSPHADDYVAVLTGARRGLFVVGGSRPGTQEPTGEIWFTTLRASRWIEVRAAFRPEVVLAATFSFATDQLYVLDTTGGDLRLTAIDFRRWGARELARWPRSPLFDRYFLTLDLDGQLLLSASSDDLDAHAYARLVDDLEVVTLEGLGLGFGSLVVEPMIDTRGTTLVLEHERLAKKKPKKGNAGKGHPQGKAQAQALELRRHVSLPMLSACLDDLEGLL